MKLLVLNVNVDRSVLVWGIVLYNSAPIPKLPQLNFLMSNTWGIGATLPLVAGFLNTFFWIRWNYNSFLGPQSFRGTYPWHNHRFTSDPWWVMLKTFLNLRFALFNFIFFLRWLRFNFFLLSLYHPFPKVFQRVHLPFSQYLFKKSLVLMDQKIFDFPVPIISLLFQRLLLLSWGWPFQLRYLVWILLGGVPWYMHPWNWLIDAWIGWEVLTTAFQGWGFRWEQPVFVISL